jgi:hypothetical protein
LPAVEDELAPVNEYVFGLQRAATLHMLDWGRRCRGDLRRYSELEIRLHGVATLILGIKCHFAVSERYLREVIRNDAKKAS